MPFQFRRKRRPTDDSESIVNGKDVSLVGVASKDGARSFRNLLRREKSPSYSSQVARFFQRRPSRPPAKVTGTSVPAPSAEKSEHVGEETQDTPSQLAVTTCHPPVKLPPAMNLNEQDARQMFSGAPQFTYGTVSFPWDLGSKLRDLSDCKSPEHAAFSAYTLHEHLSHGSLLESKPLNYDIGVVEIPNMLGSTGQEPGTVGLSYYIQESLSDATCTDRETGNSDEIFQNFGNFELLESQPEKLGLRKFDMTVVVDRLNDLSKQYQAALEKGKALDNLRGLPVDDKLFDVLFTKILTSPKYDTTSSDPMGIKIQIESLIRILNLKRMWYDFSSVEWRIRIGQLLFTEIASDGSMDSLSAPEDGLSEREVVLLQLLLACELYLRLEAIASMSLEECQEKLKLTMEDVDGFETLESRKTKWDLVLAQRFLGNVETSTIVQSKWVEQRSKQTLTQSLFGHKPVDTAVKIDNVDIIFQPRNPKQQIEGFFHFVRAIDWPDAEALKQDLTMAFGNSADPGTPSLYATPLSTPGALTPLSIRSTKRSSYFGSSSGAASPEMSPRQFRLQPPSALNLLDPTQSKGEEHNPNEKEVFKALIGGWLTRTYLVGLVLPGETISHLLISSLLENDVEAMMRLGDKANLYGGFVYRSRSFWSKASIVGRVVACLEDSKECMGWISSTLLPDNGSDGWIDIFNPPRETVNIMAVQASSDIFGGDDLTAVRFQDLTLPQDLQLGDHAELEIRVKLRLEVKDDAHVELPSSIASLDFDSSSKDIGCTSVRRSIELCNLVQFVSSFPCNTPPPSIITQIPDQDRHERELPGHPLHKSYEYKTISATQLLQDDIALGEDEDRFAAAAHTVVVIDARGQRELELLSRAFCSREGRDALISRVGLTCLACSIREAKGLRIRVIIRVGAPQGHIQLG